MNLDQLRYVVVLAEELHFARAAARLGVHQPRLSRQLRALEDELGVRLFERTTREVHLTPAGTAFLAEARLVLRHAERAERVARQTGRGEVGRLAIGFVGSAGQRMLPGLLRRYRRSYPGVELELREATSSEQVRDLVSGRLDVGILHAGPSGVDHPALASREVYRDELVVAMNRRRPQAHRDPVPLRSLAEEAFVLFPRRLGPALHDRIVRLTRDAGFEPRVAQEAVQMQTIIGLVAADIGVSIVPASVASLRRPDVVFRSPAPKADPISLHLAWRRGESNPLVRTLRALVARAPA
ncbi:MAG TPA: LysR substrate-binding domain-containing protein [Pseudonocardia sp.]|jgi:DNA-binding transcriptional LysR family regulator|uniref:LysR substrate-binding domain-containing protein n=1 Tax=Pseudonocardia sp. TaxID=60912 RepID=UPI002B4B015C|nr:LysR substrate-binding domain-containing protein [Pseudonocardia sp.]HLU56343.1 LysR substrate-binding domain-containing protein [Pseudonocardia sp.]